MPGDVFYSFPNSGEVSFMKIPQKEFPVSRAWEMSQNGRVSGEMLYLTRYRENDLGERIIFMLAPFTGRSFVSGVIALGFSKLFSFTEPADASVVTVAAPRILPVLRP